MIPCFIPRQVFKTELDAFIAYSETSPHHYNMTSNRDASAKSKGANDKTTDVTTQENVSAPATQTNSSSNTASSSSRHSKSQVRHRASVACAACRDRRIRCVVPQGQSECNQCRRTATECIIKNDDERRRPISKAYMSSLSDRIALLEGMLTEQGVQPPPATHPPKTKQDAQKGEPDRDTDRKSSPSLTKTQSQSQSQTESQSQAQSQPSHPPPSIMSPSFMNVPSPPDSGNEDYLGHMQDTYPDPSSFDHGPPPPAKEDSPFRMLDPKQEDIIHRLLSSRGNLSFDQLSGRLRFFGPTANSHVYADTADQFDSREPPEQVRRAERIIRSLTTATYDYLMENFWHWYNSVIQVIDRSAFEADREAQNPRFYSSFLHICILAMGYRGADMDRDDMHKISLGNRESTLHREAKYMLDIELERPGGIPSVQALLLLGDLECGVGRDNTGWMYSGMSNRLAFDIGLHLDCTNNGMPAQEVQIRRMVMRACVIFDRYWALFLGRPTSIKSQDIGMELLSDKLSMLSSDFTSSAPSPPSSAAPERDMVLDIYEQLIELMELAGRIVEMRDQHAMKRRTAHANSNNMFALNEAEDNAYLHVINLDRQLQNWYRRLPDHLAWKPANIKTAPYSFFLLHQQYHVSMILLHRPWTKYDTETTSSNASSSHPSPEGNPDAAAGVTPGSLGVGSGDNAALGIGDPSAMIHDSRASLSRNICTQQAIRVARIFWQHRQHFDGRKIFVTGIQHAGTAVLALVAALGVRRTSDADRRTYLGYLEILSDALADMSHTYHPAGRMDDLLKAILTQIRLGLGESPRSFHGFGPGSCHSGADVTAAVPSLMIPLRREAAGDVDCGYPSKRRRPGNSRRASELPRVPPPFFSTSAQPQSMHHRTSLFGGDDTSHHRHGSDVDSMLFSLGLSSSAGAGGPSDTLGLGSYMHGSAIDMDTDDMGLVTSSDAWGLGSMHSDHSQHHQRPFDTPVTNEYGPGPAGLSASSVLGGGGSNGNSSKPTGSMYPPPPPPPKTDATGAADKELSMLDPSMTEMSPGSLAGMVQSVEADEGDKRNHELDFFNFS